MEFGERASTGAATIPAKGAASKRLLLSVRESSGTGLEAGAGGPAEHRHTAPSELVPPFEHKDDEPLALQQPSCGVEVDDLWQHDCDSRALALQCGQTKIDVLSTRPVSVGERLVE
jgi:hypothetical protein